MLLAVALVGTILPATSSAATAPAGRLLSQLAVASPHLTGYSRDLFRLWVDADGDGCDTRREVLIAEARVRPTLLAGCRLSGGRWWSAYDALFITGSARLDIDHLIPISEAWRSGAWRWNAATREAFANDLGYAGSLIAVTARTNRQKSDLDPAAWMPPFADYRCTYVATWIAVKWRWRLAIDPAERLALRLGLVGCGAAGRVPKPARAAIATAPAGDGGASSAGGSAGTASGGVDPRFPYCSDAIAAGYGPYAAGTDPEYAWYRDGDGDGLVCER